MKSVFVVLFFVVAFSACSKVETIEVSNISPSEVSISAADTNKEKQFIIADNSVSVIKSSVLIEKLTLKQKENPSITATEFADFATGLIPKYGVDFWVDLADLIEQKRKSKEITEIADGNVQFNFELKTNDSKQTTFRIESPTDSCCCGYAYADFPVSNITDKMMTIIIDGKPHNVIRTKEISFSQEYILVDNKTKKKKIRSWQVPFETQPFGISGDGTKLYIEYKDTEEYKDTGLLLEISETGSLKFVAKNSPNIIANGEDLMKRPTPKTGEIIYKSGENGLMMFKSGEKQFIIDFPYVCT
jgi:hypothetical protein